MMNQIIVNLRNVNIVEFPISKAQAAKATTLGERIAIARKMRGWSPIELARAAKVSKAAVSGWESGKITNLRMENLFLLADLLNINARWLGIGDGVPARLLIKSEAEHELLVIYRALNNASQEALLGVAKAMHIQDSGDAPTHIVPSAKAPKR